MSGIPFSNSTLGATPSVGDVPTWDGDKWKSQAPSSGGGVVVKTFLASQANAIAALQGGGFLPAMGTIAVDVEGFGGGGGGGGSGGTSTPPGAGGGGARYNRATILIDLTHQVDVVIGAGGVGGTTGTAGANGGPGGDGGASYVNDVTANNVLVAFGGASGGHGSGNAASGLTQPGGDHPSLTVVTDTNQVDANATTSSNLNPKTVGVTGAGGSGLSSSGGFRSQPNNVQLDSTVANPILVGAPGGTFTGGASGGGGGNGPRGVGATGAPGQNTAGANGNPGGDAAANTGAGGGGGSPGAAGAGTPTGGIGGAGGTGWLRMTFHLSTTVAP